MCPILRVRRAAVPEKLRGLTVTHEQFNERVKKLFANHEALISRPNRIAEGGNGVFDRYKNPVLTAEHTPIF